MKIKGIIVRGKQLGRTIGFPTANISCGALPGEQLYGVYAAWFFIDGLRLPCMVNIGRHPTLPDGAPTVEAHIFDYSESLYGREAALETVAFLRPEQKFPSLEALKAQLAADRAAALVLLKAE